MLPLIKGGFFPTKMDEETRISGYVQQSTGQLVKDKYSHRNKISKMRHSLEHTQSKRELGNQKTTLRNSYRAQHKEIFLRYEKVVKRHKEQTERYTYTQEGSTIKKKQI